MLRGFSIRASASLICALALSNMQHTLYRLPENDILKVDAMLGIFPVASSQHDEPPIRNQLDVERLQAIPQ